MRKKIVVVALMLCVACTSIFAFGIGIQGGTDVAWSGKTGFDITFKLDHLPLMFAVGIPTFDPFSLGISADVWLFNPTIVGGSSWRLGWFVGVGVFADLFLYTDFLIGVGARLPIGLNIYFLRNILEGYVQVAPGIELEVGLSLRPDFVCPINYGIRVWIP